MLERLLASLLDLFKCLCCVWFMVVSLSIGFGVCGGGGVKRVKGIVGVTA